MRASKGRDIINSMALIKKVKLALFDVSPWEFTTNEGTKQSGFRYKGFDENDKIVAFNDSEKEFAVNDIDCYSEQVAKDFVLSGKEYHGKVKWWISE